MAATAVLTPGGADVLNNVFIDYTILGLMPHELTEVCKGLSIAQRGRVIERSRCPGMDVPMGCDAPWGLRGGGCVLRSSRCIQRLEAQGPPRPPLVQGQCRQDGNTSGICIERIPPDWSSAENRPFPRYP